MSAARAGHGIGFPGNSVDEAALRVSVCMATDNGANYLGDQVDSILRQLRATDELIVVDDGSSDATDLPSFFDPLMT